MRESQNHDEKKNEWSKSITASVEDLLIKYASNGKTENLNIVIRALLNERREATGKKATGEESTSVLKGTVDLLKRAVLDAKLIKTSRDRVSVENELRTIVQESRNISRLLAEVGMVRRSDTVQLVPQRLILDYQKIRGTRKNEAEAREVIGRTLLEGLKEPEQALEHLSRALEIRREVGDRHGEANTLTYIGLTLESLCKWSEAIEYYEQALKINIETRDKRGEAVSLGNIGNSLNTVGKWSEAIEYYEQALKISIETRDKQTEANVLTNVGLALVNLSRWSEAIVTLEQSLKIHRELGDRQGQARALTNIGLALESLGKSRKALECHRQSLNIDRELKDRQGEAADLGNIGVALGSLGRWSEAIEHYSQALKIDREIGDRDGQAKALTNIGIALRSHGRWSEALEHYSQALKIDREIGDRHGEAVDLDNIGVALAGMGRWSEALEHYSQALKISREIGDRHGEAVNLTNTSVALGGLERWNEALDRLNRALKINRELGDRQGTAISLANVGITFINMHEYDKARNVLRQAIEVFSKMEMEAETARLRKYELLATNALELMQEMHTLDEMFINALKSQTLTQLGRGLSEISKRMESIFRDFQTKDLPKDAQDLLSAKRACLVALSDALEYGKAQSSALSDARKVFEKWNLEKFGLAANTIENSIIGLGTTWFLPEIRKDGERQLPQVPHAISFLNGELTREISQKIQIKEYYPAELPEIEAEIRIQSIQVANTEKASARVCLVQLDFELNEKFPYRLTEEAKDLTKKKIFRALEIARKDGVELICFPELCFEREWIDEVKNSYKDLIIVCGTYYDEDDRNLCKIIISGKDYDYAKCHQSIFEEEDGKGMNCGKTIWVFQTKIGRISVLTCADFDYEHTRLSKHKIDFIINPRWDVDKDYSFQRKADIDIDLPDGSRNSAFMLQINANRAQYADAKGGGGTAILCFEHKYRIQNYKNQGLRPNDVIKYKIFQAKDEMMLVADLNLGSPTGRRTKTANWYRYEGQEWKKLDEKGVWLQ